MSDSVAVPISQIVIDDRLQPRCDGLSDEHVASLMENAGNVAADRPRAMQR